MLTPICLFTYNRIDETKQTIKALQKNYLAAHCELFIFSDGPKKDADIPKIHQIREYLKTINGFKSVEIYESRYNKGLANSIIEGVTQIFEKYEKIIVLEDDLITSPNFLNFTNQALNFYNNTPEIFSISGYTLALPSLKKYPKDFYLGKRASSLGWGTWKDKWEKVDWEVKNYNKFKTNFIEQIKFSKLGSDMPKMLHNQMHGKIDSWAIRWCYHQFQNKFLTVFPKKSKLIHIGYGEEATNTKITKRFDTPLDYGLQTNFEFDLTLTCDPKLIKEFRRKYSIYNRLKDKLYK